jgi:hypothetical protein
MLPKKFPVIDRESRLKSLIVETRELKHNEFVIKNTIHNLGDNWGHIIYCGKDNENQIRSICESISDEIEIRCLDFNLDVNSYNNLFLDINFWDEIDCDKVFIYQTDTFICKKFDSKFLEFDYLGAGWASENHLRTLRDSLGIDFDLKFGNGGLSLRSKWIIEKSLKDVDFCNRFLSIDGRNKFKMDKIPEDVFYSLYTYFNGKYLEDNSEFSVEFIEGYSDKIDLDKMPFGFHKLDKFFGWEKVCVINK